MTLATFTETAVRDTAIAQARRSGASIAEIGRDFGLSNGRVSGILRRLIPPAELKQIERDRRSRAQAIRHDALRNELLADIAPCRCPACGDPECDVLPGHCHNCRTEHVAIAGQTHSGQRTVTGYPLMFCSRQCRGHSTKGALGATAHALLADGGRCGSPTCCDAACEVPTGQCHRAGCTKPARRAWGTDARLPSVRGVPLRHCSKSCERLDDEQLMAAAASRLAGKEREIREAMRRELRVVPTSKAARLLGTTPRQVQRQLGGELIVFGGVPRRAFNVADVVRAAPDRRAVSGALNVELSDGSAGRTADLTSDHVARIRALRAKGGPGASVRAIARTLGVPKGRVERFLEREKLSRKP